MVSDEKLFDVAVDYYIKKKKQKEIAKEYGVSNVQISKYLKLAEQRNIVSVTVNPPNLSKEDLQWYQIMFKELFGIENLILTPESENIEKSTGFLVNFAVKYIMETYTNKNLNIGIGLGQTMHGICSINSESEKKSKWKYYPVCATIQNKSSKYFDYEKLLESVSTNWGGSFSSQLVNMMYFSNTHEVDLQEPISKYFDQLDVLITGIGSSFTMHPATREMFFSKDEMEDVLTKNLVGDIVNFFFDINGKIYASEKLQNQITVEQIKATPKTIAIASGLHKVESIVGALRTGLVSTLITDIKTAKHVIEYLK